MFGIPCHVMLMNSCNVTYILQIITCINQKVVRGTIHCSKSDIHWISSARINKSMIKYCGRAVAFAQYMPAKPIKHGIKVFCVCFCCAFSGIMLACEVLYCGKKDKKTDGTSVQVCDRLMKEAELLTRSHGCTLYTNN